MRIYNAIFFAALLATATAFGGSIGTAQTGQGPDTAYDYGNKDPAYETGSGPAIVFSAKNSVFVRNGSVEPMVKLARSDGFSTLISDRDLDDALLSRADILVIANAYVRDEFRNHPAMTPPSAFSDEEIERVRRWVESGGNLLVLADHAPLGGGSSKLAEAFGFTYLNGHALETKYADAEIRHVVITFKPNQGLNTNTPVTDGSTGRKPIKVFHTFGGQAFISAPDAMQVLTIPEGWSAIFTYKLAEEIRTAPRIDASGMAQGAIMEVGKGRVAIFGEAGGFTAQVSPRGNLGFNTEEGSQNPEFVLSVLRWLAHYQPKG